MLSGALVAAGTAAVGSPPMGIVIGAVAALFALGSVRPAGTLVLARRDGRGVTVSGRARAEETFDRFQAD